MCAGETALYIREKGAGDKKRKRKSYTVRRSLPSCRKDYSKDKRIKSQKANKKQRCSVPIGRGNVIGNVTCRFSLCCHCRYLLKER